ncbi:hypothetical protein ACQUFY_10825 [Robbsia andropogonis]|uniref:hypothetical protein n=1 Tax=Robbsia andropogonis TaxID=28092 RepID=UPI003D21C5AF
MNQSDYAKRHGVSRKAVTTWKQRGWLVFSGDEIDADASDENLARYRRGGSETVTQTNSGNTQGNKATSQKNRVTSDAAQVTIKEGETGAEAAIRILAATGADMSFDEAKRVKENYLALQAQLEYDKNAGLVVAVADVAKLVGEEYAKVRTRLLSIPAEHAPQIQRLKSVVEVQDTLRELIVKALEELTQDGDSHAQRAAVRRRV